MYNKIVNPLTNKKVDISSKLGRNIIRNYIKLYMKNILGGADKELDDGLQHQDKAPDDDLQHLLISDDSEDEGSILSSGSSSNSFSANKPAQTYAKSDHVMEALKGAEQYELDTIVEKPIISGPLANMRAESAEILGQSNYEGLASSGSLRSSSVDNYLGRPVILNKIKSNLSNLPARGAEELPEPTRITELKPIDSSLLKPTGKLPTNLPELTGKKKLPSLDKFPKNK